MKNLQLEELIRTYPDINRGKLAEAFTILQKLAEAGVNLTAPPARLGRHHGVIVPDTNRNRRDVRTIKLRTRR